MLLTGVTIPVVTPFDVEGRPDVALGGYYRRARARAGVTRILLLGSNGEGPLVPTADLEVFLAPAVREWRAAAGDGAVVMVNATAAGAREAQIVPSCPSRPARTLSSRARRSTSPTATTRSSRTTRISRALGRSWHTTSRSTRPR